MKGYTILIVEDDLMIGELLKKILEREGYSVHWCKDGRDVHRFVMEVDIIIMDIMLPGDDGLKIASEINKTGLNVPIIFLSARSDIDSRLDGLTIGEDYLVKPFDPRELLLRLQKLLNNRYGNLISIKHLHINRDTKRIFIDSFNNEVALTPIERKMFFYLYDNHDQILTKEHFFQYLWQFEDRNPNILNVHMKKIRTKIDDIRGDIIENIYGEGYRMNTYIKK
ncbi:response regulator transcription factor [Bacillus massilinigeriensis]|uniref:response regulator transcription factor n=1 Tax=Bacillus mediterraneensis TaxID=1805474 RepID=UPI0008F8B3F3|nr:response regulator transcription factor [Bacillus mediterraneensis]